MIRRACTWRSGRDLPALPDEDDILTRWERLLEWRRLVQAALEPFRAAKHSSLDAQVTLSTPEPAAIGLSAPIWPTCSSSRR